MGCGLRLDQEPVRIAGHDGKAGHDGVALDRRRHGKERANRPRQQPAGNGVLGSCAQQPDPRHGNAGGAAGARYLGGRGSLSLGDRGDGGDAADRAVARDSEQGRTEAESQSRGLSAPGVHAIRDLGLGHGIGALAAVAREGNRAAVRIQARSNLDARLRQEVRLRRSVARQATGRLAENQGGQGQGRLG